MGSFVIFTIIMLFQVEELEEQLSMQSKAHDAADSALKRSAT